MHRIAAPIAIKARKFIPDLSPKICFAKLQITPGNDSWSSGVLMGVFLSSVQHSLDALTF